MSQQLIIPNPHIPCQPGMCLEYVRETFGIGPKYPSAITCWNGSTRKHEDQNFPHNAWVPIWFSLSDNPHGHVALRQPDGGIWSASSPTASKPVFHPTMNDLMDYYKGRLKYLGWTEDVEGVAVLSVVAQGGLVFSTKRVTMRLPEPPSQPRAQRRVMATDGDVQQRAETAPAESDPKYNQAGVVYLDES